MIATKLRFFYHLEKYLGKISYNDYIETLFLSHF